MTLNHFSTGAEIAWRAAASLASPWMAHRLRRQSQVLQLLRLLLLSEAPLNTVEFTDKRTDVWSRDFMIWIINFGLWAVAWAGQWEKRVWADYE